MRHFVFVLLQRPMHALLELLAGLLEDEKLVAAPTRELLVFLDSIGHLCPDLAGNQLELVHEVAVVPHDAIELQLQSRSAERGPELSESLNSKQECGEVGTLQVAIADLKHILSLEFFGKWTAEIARDVHQLD